MKLDQLHGEWREAVIEYFKEVRADGNYIHPSIINKVTAIPFYLTTEVTRDKAYWLSGERLRMLDIIELLDEEQDYTRNLKMVHGLFEDLAGVYGTDYNKVILELTYIIGD